jgi:hypothetical protein
MTRQGRKLYEKRTEEERGVLEYKRVAASSRDVFT